MQAFRRRCSDFCLSLPFALLIFLAAVLIVMLRAEVVGVLVFVGIMTVLLVLCDDITVTTLPFLLLSMFVLKCYDSFQTFIVFAPFAVLPIAALIFHILCHKAPFTRGKSLWGTVAVAVAVTLGGWFSISFKDYFSPTSLFYIFGLGVGMIGVYFLLKREFQPSDRYGLVERVLALFYIAGFFGVFMMASHFCLNYQEVLKIGINVQWSNNLSTMMMFFLPVPFYYALTKNRLHILSAVLFYATIVCTGSRGGMLMGAFELFLCVLFVSIRDRWLRRGCILIALFGLLLMAMNVETVKELFLRFAEYTHNENFDIEKEPRYMLLVAALRDFKNNPIFGQGIGYTGNSEIYSPVAGAANWYHMMFFQVIGSFGIVGILAYGYQFFLRLRLIFHKVSDKKLVLGLSYAGILLMSQLNPGEFCPVPYEMLTVLLFILLELPEHELTDGSMPAFTPISAAFSKS